MCGIFGAVDRESVHMLLDTAERMQLHRGPDGQGKQTWTIGDWQVGLAHQRLAIIDLTSAGAQPMSHDGGRTWIAFNGEIYNYLELRAELERKGHAFQTQTDTEVILAAISEWGFEGALRRFNGMWAFAWLDSALGELRIARDRFGVKPCYLLHSDRRLLFGSEIKSLLATSGARHTVDKSAVSAYLDQIQVDFDNRTFFQGISKVPAGHFVRVDLRTSDLKLEFSRYWSLLTTEVRVPMRFEEALEEVRFLLDDAVRLRLRSDVPIGILLSGGLDSSAIAGAVNQCQGAGEIVYVGAVSNDTTADESQHMRVVARHLGRPLHEVQLEFGGQVLLDLIKRVTWHNDEPIGGFSCVAQYLLMRCAKECGVTVLLSGQGADEAFCGYLKYVGFHIQELARRGRFDRVARSIAEHLIQGTVLRDVQIAAARRYLPSFLKSSTLSLRGPALDGYAELPLGLAPGSSVNQRQVLDFERYSVPALTHWEDRNSMAFSREVRDPFLDYRLVQLGVALPMSYKLRNGWTKYVLRRATEGRIPKEICWRRDKKGFTTPEAGWLRRELRPAMEAIAAGEARCVRAGLVNAAAFKRRYQSFLTGTGPGVMSRQLFQCLSLESWLESFGPYLEST
jgi:asparagine synthase (glutamine-hydrolysing)